MKAGFKDALALAAAGQAPVPGAVVVPGAMGLHEQLVASVAAREGGAGQGGTYLPTVTAARLASAARPAGAVGSAGTPQPPIPRWAPGEDRDLGLAARKRRGVSRGTRGPQTIEEALGEADPAQPKAPALEADVAPGAAQDLRGGDGEATDPEQPTYEALAGPKPREPKCVLNHEAQRRMLRDRGLAAQPCAECGWLLSPAQPTEEQIAAALAKEVDQPLPLEAQDPAARWPDGHPGFQACPVCQGAGTIPAGRKGQVPCGRCGGSGEVPRFDIRKPYARVDIPREIPHEPAESVESAAPEPAGVGVPLGLAGGGLDGNHPAGAARVGGPAGSAGAGAVAQGGAVGATYSRCPEHPIAQPWCIECAASRGAEPVDPGWPDTQVYAYVEGFNDSPEGPIRFPGSVAESNQGPDRRYQPWMDACLPLAAVEANEPDSTLFEFVLPVAEGATPAPALTYDLPTDLYALPPFCYVAGPAGTGKTFQAKAWAASDPEGVVLAATTGIAAVNLGEGCTINSLFRYYNTASLTEAFTGGWLEAQIVKLRRTGLRRVVLDEVSMLDGDQLTILSRAFDNVNSSRGADDPEVGLVLVGDFAQLPPVKASYAFESAEWDRYAKATYRLTTIRRQADLAFIEALQAVRRGDHEAALQFFRPRMETQTHPTFDGTTILAKNEAVDKYNQLRLDKVAGQALKFPSSRWGKLRTEWGGKPKPVGEWGVPEVLTLKLGALVMVLANRNIAEHGQPPEYLYVNGDLGVVVEGKPSACLVQLQRTGEVVQVDPITRENTIPLEPGRRKALRAEGHPERISANGKQEVVGAVTYLPLRLAWGTTVHKSQGLSLDTVQVNMRDPFFASPSMLYVALSRARTAEGLRLVGTPEGFRARCKVAEQVRGWL